MSDKTLPFVITDRRKFNAEGESRPDADPSPEREPRPETNLTAVPEKVSSFGEAGGPAFASEPQQPEPSEDIPAAPTPEQMEQSRLAFQATADRLDLAVRSANPGMDHPPPMSFDQLIQSVYMQCVLQLGGGTPEGQQPQIDILGARQSIDMLGILEAKTKNNITPAEETLLLSAIFELRLAFLEVTQALARSAQQRATAEPPQPTGPRIVR
jgi:hypothetical protein